MLDALPLPPHPNLEQFKKQAKELLKACKAGDPQIPADWLKQWFEVQLIIDPALASARRLYTPGEIALRIRQGIERVIDGYEVARRVRKECAATQVKLIAVTGFGQPDDRQKAHDAGFDSHLVKPVNLDELRKQLCKFGGWPC